MARKPIFVFALIVPIISIALIAFALSGQPVKMRIGHNIPVTDLPFIIAKELKLFEKYGLEVESIRRTPTDDLLAAGELDGTIAANTDKMIRLAAARGVDLKIIANLINRHIMAFVVRDDFREGRATEELRGAEVGVISVNGGSGFAAYQKALRKLGVDSSSVRPVQLQYNLMIVTLVRGQIKAAALNVALLPRAYRIAEQSGVKLKVLFNFSEDPYPFTVVTFRKDFLDKNPQAVSNFLKAMVEAVYELKNNKPLALRLLESHFKISDAAAREAIYDLLARVVAPDFDLVPRDIELAVDDNLRQDKRFDPAKVPGIADGSFVDNLEKSGFLNQLRK